MPVVFDTAAYTEWLASLEVPLRVRCSDGKLRRFTTGAKWQKYRRKEAKVNGSVRVADGNTICTVSGIAMLGPETGAEWIFERYDWGTNASLLAGWDEATLASVDDFNVYDRNPYPADFPSASSGGYTGVGPPTAEQVASLAMPRSTPLVTGTLSDLDPTAEGTGEGIEYPLDFDT